jgi:hypothetical protein
VSFEGANPLDQVVATSRLTVKWFKISGGGFTPTRIYYSGTYSAANATSPMIFEAGNAPGGPGTNTNVLGSFAGTTKQLTSGFFPVVPNTCPASGVPSLPIPPNFGTVDF